MNALKTPVAVIVFKRLDATQKMFEAVRLARPQELFVIADGWRGEAEKKRCLAVRTHIETSIDWPCTVHKIYSDTNLGCKMRVVSGLNEVFAQVEEAIIVEDDCVPDQTFFRFCTELLERYRHEPRIMQISGLNTQHPNPGFGTKGHSYYYSDLGEIWGWATWRRAWQHNDIRLEAWPKAKKDKMLERHFNDPRVVDYWEHLFDEIYGKRDTPRGFDAWGAQWVFARFINGGFSCVPKTNLIQNFGDDGDAARPKDIEEDESRYRRPVVPLEFPLVHPPQIEINRQADDFTLTYGFRIKQKPIEKILFFFKQHLPLLHHTLKKLYKVVRRR